MPLVTIDILQGRSDEEIDEICECVQVAMINTLGVPEHDRFQIVSEHTPRTLRFDRTYLKGDRGDGFILVRLTLAAGRTVEAKQSFYATLVELLSKRIGVRPEDVTITLVENGREDWSFGQGQASYLELPKEEWR